MDGRTQAKTIPFHFQRSRGKNIKWITIIIAKQFSMFMFNFWYHSIYFSSLSFSCALTTNTEKWTSYLGIVSRKEKLTWLFLVQKYNKYCERSNISGTLIGNEIVAHSDVVRALPAGAAPTTSSFSTEHMASMTQRQEETWNIYVLEFGATYIRDLTAPVSVECLYSAFTSFAAHPAREVIIHCLIIYSYHATLAQSGDCRCK